MYQITRTGLQNITNTVIAVSHRNYCKTFLILINYKYYKILEFLFLFKYINQPNYIANFKS